MERATGQTAPAATDVAGHHLRQRPRAEGISDAELVARLYDALATLPPAERAAAVVAIGLGEGPAGAAVELGLDLADADAVTRNALQLLRGALGDIDIDDPATYGQLPRRRGAPPGGGVGARTARKPRAGMARGYRDIADPPGLPLGTGSLEATKVGTGGMDRAGGRLSTSTSKRIPPAGHSAA